MGTAERRMEIMRVLCRRRHDTIANLACEFGVSERTILRDIEELSLKEPIYTQRGKYSGGVYVTDGYYMDRMYMRDEEISVLEKIEALIENGRPVCITDLEFKTFRNIITQYKKPITRKAKK